jgi:hypothetical protein
MKPLNEISTLLPNTGNVDMNNKRIDNLSSLDISSVENILTMPKSACNVETANALVSGVVLSNTAYCGPLQTTMDVKGKRIINQADAVRLVNGEDPAVATEKLKQGINYAFLNSNSLTRDKVLNYSHYNAGTSRIYGVQTLELTNT